MAVKLLLYKSAGNSKMSRIKKIEELLSMFQVVYTSYGTVAPAYNVSRWVHREPGTSVNTIKGRI